MKHHKVMLPVLASHLFQVKQHPLDGVYSTCSRLCCHTSPPCAQHSFAEDALSYTNQGPAGPAPQKRNRHHVTIIHPPWMEYWTFYDTITMPIKMDLNFQWHHHYVIIIVGEFGHLLTNPKPFLLCGGQVSKPRSLILSLMRFQCSAMPTFLVASRCGVSISWIYEMCVWCNI